MSVTDGLYRRLTTVPDFTTAQDFNCALHLLAFVLHRHIDLCFLATRSMPGGWSRGEGRLQGNVRFSALDTLGVRQGFRP
jgi:hypothetical protein